MAWRRGDVRGGGLRRAYYNELDPKMAAWLRELIRRGLLPDGDVDERDVRDVDCRELAAYGQVHLFAGVGGWAYALRLAGWPDERPVWTGSCPCQPFSVAGAGGGTDDPRHLWPAFRWLVAQRRPSVVFGEQVASKAGRAWLSGVRLDLEAMGYAVGAADLCAACVGEKAFGLQADFLRRLVESGDPRVRGREVEVLAFADYVGRILAGPPHIRQRLFWVADAEVQRPSCSGAGFHVERSDLDRAARGLPDAADADGRGGERGAEEGTRARGPGRGRPSGRGASGGLPDAEGSERGPTAKQRRHGNRSGPWSDFDIVPFRDGTARRVEPGTFPLADGVPARVGRLRGYGNAIVPQVAAAFVRAYLEARA